jgi:hypothetical protein
MSCVKHFSHWKHCKNFVENDLPNKATAVRANNLLNDKAISHFLEIFKRRQKEVSLDSYLVNDSSKTTV